MSDHDDLAGATAAAFAADGALARAFKSFTPRSEQTELAQQIAGALERDDAIVAEAGTGVGKTFAYLVPALLAGGKVLVSTGTRTLQDQLFDRDLPALRQALGRHSSTALLKGRANYVCRYHLRRNLAEGRFARREQGEQLRRIEWFAKQSATGDRADCATVPEDAEAWQAATSTRDNCLGQECADWNECFVVRARRTAQTADIVVVNHHLFCADLALRDEGISELLPSANAVIFDEAHLLPETCSIFFGVGLSGRQLLELARDAAVAGLAEARDGADWLALSDRLQRAARAQRAAWPATSARYDADALLGDVEFEQATCELRDTLAVLAATLAAAAPRGADVQRCAVRAASLLARLEAWIGLPASAADAADVSQCAAAGPHGVGADARADGHTVRMSSDGANDAPPAEATDAAEQEPPVRWAEAHAQSVTLHRTPVSVAAPFTRHRESSRCAWVFVSATLALGGDFGHFVRALGLEDAVCRRWHSPFDFVRQARLYIPTGCGDPGHPAFTDRVLEKAWPLLRANRGRAFVLCTSLRAVRRAAQVLRDWIGSDSTLTLLVQGELPRAELLRRYRQATAPVLIGAASFWQGVDVRGEQLSLVVIDKLPFASPDDPVLQARMRALRRAGRDPFSELQLPSAAVTLKQGAGRLIRSEQDRGVLMIGDERLVTKGYGRRLLASLPPFQLTRDAGDALDFVVDMAAGQEVPAGPAPQREPDGPPTSKIATSLAG